MDANASRAIGGLNHQLRHIRFRTRCPTGCRVRCRPSCREIYPILIKSLSRSRSSKIVHHIDNPVVIVVVIARYGTARSHGGLLETLPSFCSSIASSMEAAMPAVCHTTFCTRGAGAGADPLSEQTWCVGSEVRSRGESSKAREAVAAEQVSSHQRRPCHLSKT